MPPKTRSDQGFFSGAVSTVSVDLSVANNQRVGDFQPSFEEGDFQYDTEVEYFEVNRLLKDQNKIPPEVEFKWEDEEYANAGYAARTVSFVLETVADDRPVLLPSTTIIQPRRTIKPHPNKGRGNASASMRETSCLVLS
jgi:hypothetical protein